MSGPASLALIVRALGGDLWAGGLRANVPGPGHGPDDRSVSLLVCDGRLVIHSFAGDDWREILADLVARGLVGRDGRLDEAGVSPGPGILTRIERSAVARRLWSEAGPLTRTLSERHLHQRGVASPPMGLRHHPAVAAAVYADRGPRRPALLAAIRDARGELAGVEVTYLAGDGARAAVRVPRKTVGLCPAGAGARLAAAGPRLLVGEGVFTCLAAAARFGLPAWALLSAGNLRTWRAPGGVRSVLIAADGGQAGASAARVLAARLEADGLACAVRFPPPPFGDWNEARMAELEGEEGRGSAGAANGWSGPPARRSPDDP